jgi:hypothetical protein
MGIRNKNGAIELSIGTIVVIVLAMSMLILGLVLIRGIFTGATDNVTELNDKVKDEIRGLFQDESQRVILRLTEDTATIQQGDEFGIAFGIKNIQSGTVDATTFNYEVELDDINIREKCGVTEQQALDWARFSSGRITIPPGQIEYDRIVFVIPENAPLCTTKYRLRIWEQGDTKQNAYANPPFIVKIDSSGIF